MRKEYLVEGAKLICLNGSMVSTLKIPHGHGYTSGGKKKATCKDCKACINISHFGACKKNKQTNLCSGYMELADEWERLDGSFVSMEKIGGENALTMDSVLLCKKGGIIIPLTSGQDYDQRIDWDAFMRKYYNVIRWAAGKNLLCHVFGGDPINVNTGNYIYEKKDLVVRGITQLSFHMFYNSMESNKNGILGEGWHHNYEMYLKIDDNGKTVKVCHGDGREVPYRLAVGDVYAPVFGDSGLLKCENNGYRYCMPNGEEYTFGLNGLLFKRRNPNGLTDYFKYNRQGQLVEVTGANGGKLLYHYNKEGKLIRVEDHTGRKVQIWYQYGKLWKFVNAAGYAYTYSYNENGKLESILTPRGVLGVKNTYDAADRVIKQEMPDGGVIEMIYDDKNNRSYMKKPNGSIVIYENDDLCRNIRTVYEDGEEEFEYNDRNQKTSYIDKNGNSTKYQFDENGNLSGIINALGEQIGFSYDADGNLITVEANGKELQSNIYNDQGYLQKVTDALKRSKSISYNEIGQPEHVTLSDGSLVQITYDERGNIESVTNPYNEKIFYAYDNLNRLVSVADSENNQYTYGYDEMDHLISITNPEGNSRFYHYNESGKPVEVIDYDEGKISITYNCMNKPEKTIDKEGNTTVFLYDQMGNMIQKTSPTGGTVLYHYDKKNLLVKKEAKDVAGSISITTTYAYDTLGNLLRKEVGDGESVVSVVSYEYDSLNRMKIYTNPIGGKTIYEYDNAGHISEITDPFGNKQFYSYNDAGELVEVADTYGNKTCFTYNKLGQIESVTDRTGKATKYRYMPGGRLLKVISPYGSIEYTYDSLGRVKSKSDNNGCQLFYQYDKMGRILEVQGSANEKKNYTYDVMGNVTSTTDACGNTTLFEYFLSGKLAAVIDAMGNRTEYTYDGIGQLITISQYGESKEDVRTEQYERNSFGQIESITDALGGVERFIRDAMGRVVCRIDQEGMKTNFSYAAGGQIESIIYGDGSKVEMKYSSLGQLELIRDWLGETKIERDFNGKPLRITDHAGRTVQYEWGHYGEKSCITYPDGKRIRFIYDDMLQLERVIREDGGREQMGVSYRYDDRGRLIEKLMPGGIRTSLKYQNNGQLAELTHEDGKGILDRFWYKYDAMGNKILIHKERRGIPEDSGDFAYGYDALNRLISVAKDGKLLRSYEYDTFGNRIGMKDHLKGMENSLVYNAINQLMKEEVRMEGDAELESGYTKTYNYDKRGNLTEEYLGKRLMHQYVYNAMNRLAMAWDEDRNEAIYRYNGFGQRVSKNDEEYLLDLTKPYQNLLGIRGERKQDYYWDDNPIALEDEMSLQYYLTDEMGSVLRVLYKTGKGKAYGYDEFGNDLLQDKDSLLSMSEQNGKEQPLGYTGYYKDNISGTYFAQAREYMPEKGRFMAHDMIKGYKMSPRTLNRYTYCINNPLLWVDRDGKSFNPVNPLPLPPLNPMQTTKNLVTLAIKSYTSLYDEQGRTLLNRYIYGNGETFIADSDEWGQYMMNNDTLTRMTSYYLAPIGNNLEPGESIQVNIETSVIINSTEREGKTGYMLLYGSNANEGGYQINGTVTKNTDGSITYDMNYTFNDLMDPDFNKEEDRRHYAVLSILKLLNPKITMTDYTASISWSDITTIYENHPKDNDGWLSDMVSLSLDSKMASYKDALSEENKIYLSAAVIDNYTMALEQLQIIKDYINAHPEYYGCSVE